MGQVAVPHDGPREPYDRRCRRHPDRAQGSAVGPLPARLREGRARLRASHRAPRRSAVRVTVGPAPRYRSHHGFTGCAPARAGGRRQHPPGPCSHGLPAELRPPAGQRPAPASPDRALHRPRQLDGRPSRGALTLCTPRMCTVSHSTIRCVIRNGEPRESRRARRSTSWKVDSPSGARAGSCVQRRRRAVRAETTGAAEHRDCDRHDLLLHRVTTADLSALNTRAPSTDAASAARLPLAQKEVDPL
jgi:hypothetical protein